LKEALTYFQSPLAGLDREIAGENALHLMGFGFAVTILELVLCRVYECDCLRTFFVLISVQTFVQHACCVIVLASFFVKLCVTGKILTIANAYCFLLSGYFQY
jgi:hypothetical protein